MNPVSKINQILQTLPYGDVLLSSWLNEQGYSYELQQRYRKSGWLTSIGHGAMVRSGQNRLLYGAIHALQQEAEMEIHIGGRSALNLQGFGHYVELERKEILLFGKRGIKLPTWLFKNDWDSTPVFIATSFLSGKAGIIDFKEGQFTIKISSPARAIMECLYLVPDDFDLIEAMELMEGLNLLRPQDVQVLLEECNSVKVKRLFLYFAERAKHNWFNHLQIDKIHLGSGKRSIVSNGVLIPKYGITLSKEFV
jgi:hypothetical protein